MRKIDAEKAALGQIVGGRWALVLGAAAGPGVAGGSGAVAGGCLMIAESKWQAEQHLIGAANTLIHLFFVGNVNGLLNIGEWICCRTN